MVAIAAGFTEALLLFGNRWVTGNLVFANAQTLWIAPLSTLLLMLPGAALVAVGHRLAPHVISRLLARVLIALPGVFAVCWLAYPRLHRWAIAVFAVGLTIQLARWAEEKEGPAERWVRRLSQLGIGAVALAALAVNAGYALAEWRLLRGAGGSVEDRPNVLLLVLDTVRARSLSLYGYGRKTSPVLEELASEGVTFEHAFATSSWTLPSHASLFTGRYPFELSADWLTRLDDRYPTLAEAFRGAGYRTGGFVANLMYAGRESGLARGFSHYEDWPLSPGRILEGSSLGFFILNNPRVRRALGYADNWTRKSTRAVSRDLLRWLDRQPRDRPFFAFLNLYEAHEPYLPPPPFDTAFGPLPAPSARAIVHARRADGQRRDKHRVSATEGADEERAYDGAIASMDAEIGRLLDALEERALLRETIVIVTSDHGEHHGEHGLYLHGHSLYSEVLHVPLVVVYPGRVPAGVRIEMPVSLRDVPATLTDLAGITSTGFPGRSLRSLLTTTGPQGDDPGSPVLAEVWPAPNPEPWMPVRRGYMRALVRDRFHYIRNGDGVEELYVIGDSSDVDRSGSQPWAAELARLRVAVDSVPRSERAGFATPAATVAGRRD